MPRQKKSESSAQKHTPIQSFLKALTRCVSHTTDAKNNVIMLMYWIRMHTVAKRQKLRSASIDEIMPSANANAVVKVVMVIAGPACDSASCTRW